MKSISKHRLFAFVGAFLVSVFFVQCSSGDKKVEDEPIEEIVEIEPVVEEEIWVIEEHSVNDIPLTSKSDVPPPPPPTTESEADDTDEVEVDMTNEDYEITTPEAFHSALIDVEYEHAEEVEVTEAFIPLDETQTLVAYNKKGKEQAELQVVTGADGEIEQIIFADQNHKDIYDVSTGMTAKEAKRLRKELKHMEHKGDHFLYDDQSNIMYLLDATDAEGDEITEAEIETLEVRAIIWKDKKHHKKD